jgi:hypothetical protein
MIADLKKITDLVRKGVPDKETMREAWSPDKSFFEENVL